jgi:hypothetical protein
MNPGDNPNVFESSGDEDLNQYSVMRKNQNHIGFGSRVNTDVPNEDVANEEKSNANQLSEEEPLKATPRKKMVKFDDPQTTQEEREPKKREHNPRFSKRATNYHRKNLHYFKFAFLDS